MITYLICIATYTQHIVRRSVDNIKYVIIIYNMLYVNVRFKGAYMYIYVYTNSFSTILSDLYTLSESFFFVVFLLRKKTTKKKDL